MSSEVGLATATSRGPSLPEIMSTPLTGTESCTVAESVGVLATVSPAKRRRPSAGTGQRQIQGHPVLPDAGKVGQ